MEYVIQFFMAIIAFFLIVLILLQRGRGGGLAGALGGMGGQSAFGSKAGDVFTKITSGLAIVWILLCVGALKYMNSRSDLFAEDVGAAAAPAEESVEGGPGDPSPVKTSEGKSTLPAENSSDDDAEKGE
ncbi:MAG TPA: preprotein translocase subunit SecG [Pirellulales bacterium]|nr:preprotein translocase subunit SecG [Pirellulales bacterium]